MSSGTADENAGPAGDTGVIALAHRASAEEARAELSRGWRRLWPWRRSPTGPPQPIWLPFLYLGRTALDRRGERVTVRVLVCANTGVCSLARFDARSAPRAAGVELLPARLARPELEQLGRRHLQTTVLALRKAGRTLNGGGELELHDVGFPCWLSIFRRRGGSLDADLVDGFSGKRAGAALRQSALMALSAPGS